MVRSGMMNIRRYCRRYGFTLIEVLVSIALFVALMTAGFVAIRKGIESQRYEHKVREAKAAVRNALDRLADEMRSATPLPYVSNASLNNSYNQSAVVSVSGVLYPDPYGAKSNQGGYTQTFGTDKVENSDSSKEKYIYSTDQVIFTRLTDRSQGSDLSKYMFVEWTVDKNNTSKIIRRVYNVNSNKSFYCFNVYDNIAMCWAKIGKFSRIGDTDGSNDVAVLPGPYDKFTFTVSRGPNKNQTGISDVAYDLNTLKVDIKATIYRSDYVPGKSNASNYSKLKTDIEVSTRVSMQVNDNYY